MKPETLSFTKLLWKTITKYYKTITKEFYFLKRTVIIQ